MDSIKSLLNNRYLSEPPEIKQIKNFILSIYQSNSEVIVQQSKIIITVPSAALANSLRLRVLELQKLIQTKKKIVIYIGNIKK